MATNSKAFDSSYVRPLLASVLIVGVLYVAKPVIVPLTLAVLLTFVLTPLVALIQNRGIGRIIAVLLTALLTISLFVGVGTLVGFQVQSLAEELPNHRKEIDAKVASFKFDGDGPMSRLVQMFHEIGKGEAQATADKDEKNTSVVVAHVAPASSFERLAGALTPILEPLAQAGLVVVLVIFLLVNREDLRNRVIGLLGHGRLTGTTRVLVDSAERLSQFLMTQVLINLGFGVIFGFALFCVGVPYALLWGFMAVIFRFVPFIGTLVAVAFPLTISFAVSPSWTQPILVLAVFGILEVLTANVIEPLLIGRGTGVSPVALLVAAAFWTWIWGPIGLVLATPLTVCLVVLGQHVPRWQFFALLLGDKPALAPSVSYYQRLLAHDQKEAMQIAAEFARVNGLEKVYDGVLLPALTLARRDRKNSGLDAEDETALYQATKDIAKQLAEAPRVEDGSPKPVDPTATVAGIETGAEPTPPTMILGCPAHNEAEEISIEMLADLIKSDGFTVRVASTRELPAEITERVKQLNPRMVFISIVPPRGFVQARYLCARLRKQFPRLPIVVGYFGHERNYDDILARLRTAGVDTVTTSLIQTRSKIRALLSPVEIPTRPNSVSVAGRAPEKNGDVQGSART